LLVDLQLWLPRTCAPPFEEIHSMSENPDVTAAVCCGTAQAAAQADACCDPTAKAEAIDAGAGCCGNTENASAQTDANVTAVARPAGSPIEHADPSLPVVVVGAGPVGLAAAAQLAERGLTFVVLEAGEHPAAAVRQWGHVRLFSPWRFNIDAAAARLLTDAGWVRPDDDKLPTGAQLADDYLQPLADLPAIKPHVRYGARVVAITRLGLDRVRTAGRDTTPFLVRLAGGEDILAAAVIDASGTWGTPNVLGAAGIPAHGEIEAAAYVESALPDVLGRDRERFAGHRILVVGAGHSAANTLLSLAELAEQEPGTTVTWAIRAPSPARAYGGEAADALPARGAIGSRLRAHVDNDTIALLSGFGIRSLAAGPDGVEVSDGVQSVVVDRIVSATGFRPDHSIVSELRLDLDPILGSTRRLAPVIDPNEHSCGTVPPHGVDELTHPEPGFYAIGVKSYGRAPTFLLATGYEQARSVVAALAGDWAAARDVQLDLPETGVCNSNPVAGEDTIAADGGCCGAPAAEPELVTAGRGLATGISGGLLAAPLTLVTIGGGADDDQTGGCCG
jgi:thioredoxin reductase